MLSLQVSGMQSIELGMSDMYILENYNLVWIITDYNMKKIERLLFLMRKSLLKPMPRVTIDFSATGPNIKDEAGNTIIEMVATFVLMDRDTRKVHPVMRKSRMPLTQSFQNHAPWSTF